MHENLWLGNVQQINEDGVYGEHNWSLIMHDLCIFFVQKSFLTQNILLFDEINLTTRGPLYTCLVNLQFEVPHFMCARKYFAT